jgi:Caspase domain
MHNWINSLAIPLLSLTIAVPGASSAIAASNHLFLAPQPTNRLSLAPQPIAQKIPRIALVIGNANYPVGSLKNPVNDATDMAKALRELGFEVILLTDANQRSMGEAIEQFNDKLSQNGVGLFYYAGHGMQVKGENYLIPIGAKIRREQDLIYEAIPLGMILGAMESAKTSTNLVILDACRNNPFNRGFRSAQVGLANVQAAKGTLISFATNPGAVAKDSYGVESRNSPYTASLLQHIRKPSIRVEEMFKSVRQSVLERTREEQLTWESTSLIGTFAFNDRSDIITTPAPRPETTSNPLPKVESAPAPTEPPRRDLIQSSNDIALQLQSCKPEGDGVKCEFLVTDQTQNRQICVSSRYSNTTGSNIVDVRGTKYEASYVRFGTNQNKNYVCQNLSRGVGIMASITFENLPRPTEPFALVEIIVRQYGRNVIPIRFKNVSISD